MKEKFLVLGIGAAQADLLEKITESFEVHALSNSQNGPGLKYVDFFALIDIGDKDAVLDYAKENQIDFVYSIGSDIAMPTVTYVAENLGLPSFISHETASICNNKVTLRESLREIYGSVNYEVISAREQTTEIPMPVVIKPVDSQGQRGVQTITELEKIPDAFSTAVSYSKCGLAIIEEKIEGQEISVNTYMVNGKIKLFLPSDRVSWSGLDGGLIHKHVLPTKMSEKVINNVWRLVEETAATLNIKNGPVYYQIKVRECSPYLIEVTPRLDGCHLWRLIKKSTGIDLLEETISHLCRNSASIPEHIETMKLVLEFFCQPPDTLFSKPVTAQEAIYTQWYYKPGEIIRRINGKMEKCGFQIVASSKK